MAYLVFWLAYSFDWDGVLGVLVGVFFWLRWRTWCFGWRILLIEMAYLLLWLVYLLFLFSIFIYWDGMVWHGMFRVVPFAFSVEKSTPDGKKYASGAGALVTNHSYETGPYQSPPRHHWHPLARAAATPDTGRLLLLLLWSIIWRPLLDGLDMFFHYFGSSEGRSDFWVYPC